MSQKTRAQLKALFETGDFPSENDFIDLFDSQVNKTDDSWSSVQKYSLTDSSGSSISTLTNLNAVTPGLYATGAGASNTPSGVSDAGWVFILGHGTYVLQIFKTLTGTTQYLRSYNGSSWSAWKRIIDDSLVGVADGVAGLDGSGKVPTAQLPAAVVGAMAYQGTWNANTNSPSIPSAASGNKGYYYKVSTAGSTSIDGITDWKVGDWIVSNGSTWDKIDNTDQVTSVAGKQGAVTLVYSDISGDIPQSKITNLVSDIGTIQSDITTLDNNTPKLTGSVELANFTESLSKSIEQCDTTSGNITVSLLPNSTKRILTIIKIASANTVTIVPDGTETVEGNATVTLTAQYDKCQLYFDGTGAGNVIFRLI